MSHETADEILSAAQRSKIRRLAAPAPDPAQEDAGELNVVPYLDIVMNIMMFVLATVSVAFATTIPSNAAHAGPSTHPSGPVEGLHLTALITHDGIALVTSGGAVAPGCGGHGAGVTVPKSGGAQDLATLTACARRIKGAQPAYATETQVVLSASPDVPYAEVITVMDGLRRDESGPLFPEVVLGAVR